jgi:large subunit ribosomal protein L34
MLELFMKNVTRKRRYGFRLRMSTHTGRKIINNKRSQGRHKLSI